MEALTNDEMVKTPMTVHGKVLSVLNEWEGFADKVENLPCVKK